MHLLARAAHGLVRVQIEEVVPLVGYLKVVQLQFIEGDQGVLHCPRTLDCEDSFQNLPGVTQAFLRPLRNLLWRASKHQFRGRQPSTHYLTHFIASVGAADHEALRLKKLTWRAGSVPHLGLILGYGLM